MIEPLDQRGRPYMADSTANLGINFLCDVP